MLTSEMKRSSVTHFEILGAPFGDAIFCAKNCIPEVCNSLQVTLPTGRGWLCGPHSCYASVTTM